jgi:hypothetical protein
MEFLIDRDSDMTIKDHPWNSAAPGRGRNTLPRTQSWLIGRRGRNGSRS